jgi:hypothetical protein
MASDKFELERYTLVKHRETEKAVLVSETGENDDAFWLPYSQIEIIDDEDDNAVILDVPRWLAEKHNLS